MPTKDIAEINTIAVVAVIAIIIAIRIAKKQEDKQQREFAAKQTEQQHEFARKQQIAEYGRELYPRITTWHDALRPRSGTKVYRD